MLTGRFLSLCVAMAVVFAATLSSAQQGEPMRLPIEEQKLVAKTAQGEFSFEIELADEVSERSRGLMFRTDLPPNRGMLFDFGETDTVAMWMQNTPLPLDMVFILEDGTVEKIAERTTPFSPAIVSSGKPVAYVLELRAGVARMIGLKPGDKLAHPGISGK